MPNKVPSGYVLVKEYMTAKEAAEFLGLSKHTIYKYIETRRIKHYKTETGQVRFWTNDLVAFLEHKEIG
ncbi:excisionase family DNA binding domain protein [uncultured Mediterranean phage uvDeep-CGR2-KM18-C74]|nr:excisionase family DNA binding domain protein [uncultured Mediterranean phage uvDeep-CGR2-KM18-C74]